MSAASIRSVAALALAVVGLATAVSPFASSSPDGLERVAQRQGLRSSAASSRRAGRRRRSPTTPSPASTTRAWRPASPGSRGRSSCSRWRSARAGRAVAGAAAGRGGRRAAECSASHALAPIGLAGDPEQPVHRLDPRAKLVGLLGVTVVAVARRSELGRCSSACAAVLARVAVAARVPARHGLAPLAASCSRPCSLAACSSRSSATAAPRTRSARSPSTRRASRSSAAVAAKAAIGTLRRRAARRDDDVPRGAPRARGAADAARARAHRRRSCTATCS